MEGLAIKKGLIKPDIPLHGAAWGGSGLMLYPHSTTNFSCNDIQNIYEQFHLLFNQGITAPGATVNCGPNLPYFHVTEYGHKCLEEDELRKSAEIEHGSLADVYERLAGDSE